MPRPDNLIRLALTGTLPDGEIFQTGAWLRYAATVTSPQLQTFCDFAADSFEANSGGIRSMMAGSGLYKELRAYRYITGGAAPADAIAATPLQAPNAGGGSNLHPLQCALVATLRTVQVGRSYRGRMYFPCIDAALPGFQAAQTMIDAVASNVAAWFTAINAYAPDDLTVVVMSATKSTTSDVRTVEVDSRLDIQRRRANQQTELRQSVPGVVT